MDLRSLPVYQSLRPFFSLLIGALVLLSLAGFATKAVGLSEYDHELNNAPIFTSQDLVAFAENGTGTVLDVNANDGDFGADDSGITYSLGGTDAGDFSIDASGLLTFNSTPDFDSPADDDTNNIYQITVTADDGSGSNNTTTQDITVIVTPLVEAAHAVQSRLGADIDGESSGDLSGFAVDLSADGRVMAIGAPSNTNTNGGFSGHVRVFTWDGTVWTQRGGDIDGEAFDDQSGQNLSLNADGTVLAIGAEENDGNGSGSGHVRVYVWNGSTWAQRGDDLDGEATDDYSGNDVDINADGTVLAIGAIGNDGNDSNSGHVRVYVWNGTAWIQRGNDIDGDASSDLSGGSVSLSADGTILAIGSFRDTRVFVWNGSSWAQRGSDLGAEKVSLSADGTILAIGSPKTNSSKGRVKVYAWDGSSWNQQGTNIDGEASGDQFGGSLSLSADGTFLATGASQNDGNGTRSGHVRIYKWTGSAWSQQDADIDGEAAGDNSGVSVSLSADGAVLAIGAFFNGGNGSYSGHVRAYQLEDKVPIFFSSATASFAEKSTGTVLDVNANDGDGGTMDTSVSYTLTPGGDNDLFAINTAGLLTFNAIPDFESPLDANVDNDYIIEVNATTNNHTTKQTVTITVTDVSGDDAPVFTSQDLVSFAENGSGTVLDVNANDGDGGGDDTGITYSLSGTDASVFSLSTTGLLTFNNSLDFGAPADDDSNNIYHITVTANDGNNTTDQSITLIVVPKVLNSVNAQDQLGSDIDGEASGDLSGFAVDLSADGRVMAIGAPSNTSIGFTRGHVRVYVWNGDTWTQRGTDIDGEADDDQSGQTLSLSADGTVLAIGAEENDGNGSRSGHVRVYVWNGSTWTQRGNDLDGEATDDYSGNDVDINADGTVLAIGAIGNDGNDSNSGHVRVYVWNDTAWIQRGNDIDGDTSSDNSGGSVSLSADGTILAIGSRQDTRVFVWNGSSWAQRGSDLGEEKVSLSADGTILAIGSPSTNSSKGRVKVYAWDGSSWNQQGTNIDGEASGDEFGHSVSISADGSLLAIGASQNDGNGTRSGHVRIYKWTGSAWSQQDADIDGEAAGDNSGVSVSLSADGAVVAIGAFFNGGNGSYSGHVRAFRLYDPVPVITSSATASFVENSAGTILDVNANDGDGGAEDANIIYSLTAGGDNDLFSISSAGLITFNTAPDFESPQDANTDNIYAIEVNAADASNTTKQTVTITVTDIDDTPPGVTSFTMDDTALLPGETASLTLVFDEVITGLTSADFTVPNGSISEPSSSDGGTTYTATYAPNAEIEDATNEIVLDLTGIQDVAGNAGVGTAKTSNFTLDSRTPAVDFATTSSNGAESVASVDLEVGLALVSGVDVTVDYAVTGTATGSGTDFTLANGTLTFPAGTTTKNITIAIVNDAIVETNETVIVTLSNPTKATLATKTVHTYTITDNDAATLAVGDVTQVEGNSGTTTINIPVTLTGEVQDGFTVEADALISGDAAEIDANDVVASGNPTISSATLNFSGNSGEVQNLQVALNGDQVVENDETFGVLIGNVQANDKNVTIADGDATVTVTNDDAATLSIDDVTMNEGEQGELPEAVFTVTLTGAVETDISVDAAASDGTADNSDYISPGTETLNFTGNDGETQTYKPTINGDDLDEANETFSVLLSNLNASGLNVSITDDTGAGVITNDDAAPIFTSGTTVSLAENNAAAGYTAAATDADNGALTFSLGTNNDESFFSIDANTGVLTFLTAPDFEHPGDGDTNNDYEVEVKVTDGANEVTQTVSVTVTNTDDEAPVFTSGSTEAFEENKTGTVYTAAATDADSQTITYRLGNSSDQDVTDFFNLDSSSGVLSFKEEQDYETAAGNANEGKQFKIDIIASDEANSETTLALTISLIDVNEVPVVSSNPVTKVNDNEKYEYFGFITDPDDRTSFNAFNAVEALELPSWLHLKSKTSSVSLLELEDDDGESIEADFLSDAGHLVRDSQGNVIVNMSDDFDSELFQVNPDGVLSFLELKDAAGDEFELDVITAMSLDKNDILYFTSLGTSSVELFQMDMNGTVTAVRTDPDDANINTLAFLPLDMTFDHEQGSLYFLEEDGTVHYLSLSTFEIKSISISGEDSEFDKALIGINDQNQIYTYLSTRDALLIRYTEDEEGFVKETILDSEDDLERETAQILEDVEDLLFSSNDKFLFIAIDQIYEFNESVFEFEPINDAEAGVERDNPFEFEDLKLLAEANGIINYIYIDGLGELKPGEEIFFENTDPLAISAFEKVLTGKFFSRTTDLEDVNDVSSMASNRLGHMLFILDDELELNLIKDDKVFDARFELVDKEDLDNSDILRGERNWAVLGVTANGDFLLTADGSLLISISPDDLDDLFEITEIPDGPGADIQLPFTLLYEHEGSRTTISDARLDSDGNVLVILIESGGEETMSRLIKLNVATGQETELIDENSQVEDLDEFFLIQMEIDAEDNIYLTDIDNEIILKLDKSGNLSILTDLPEVFDLTISGNNQLYASTPGRLYSISFDGTATALAGRDETGTPIDGTGEEARFSEISSILIDESVGLIYILDDESVRVATLQSADFILSGEAEGQVGTHDVSLKISDMLDTELSLLHEFTITVLDATAPAITSNSQVSFNENGTDDILSLTAEDSNPNAVLSFTLSGADAALFAIDSNDQGLSFIAAPDFESPEDDGEENVYNLTLEVKDDAENSTTQELTITVNDLNDETPEFTSSNTIGIDENTTPVVSLTATDADADSNLTFSITGGADQSLFNLSGADLSLLTAEDFEQPTQQDQSYEVEVTVSDGTNSDVQIITVTITDTDDNAPIITSDGGGATATLSIAENSSAVTTITATDADAISTVSFSITGGVDQALFALANGVLSFSAAPDFETPLDNGANNAYEVEVTATDGINADTQTIMVTVTDVDEIAPDAPVITNISDDTGSSATDGVTSDRNILVYGTAEAEANVDVFSPGGKIGTVQADANGDWTLDISRFNLPEFTADMTAEAVDLAGNRSVTSDPFTLTIDFTAPDAPAITGISDDTGSSATDGITSDRNILVHGTAEVGASVDVFSPGGKIGTVEADANGDWVLDISRFTLPEFTADMTAEAFDLAGNRSSASAQFTLTIDFTAPDAPAITGIGDDTGSSANDGVTSDRNILVHGTAEANASVEVFSPGGLIGTVAADANGDWTLDITAFNLPEMVANTTAQAIDVAGNRSAISDGFVITIDFTPPAKPVITGISDDTGSSSSDGVTSDRNLLIHGTAEAQANVEVFSPGGLIGTVAADANGDWTLDITAFNLPEMVANTTAQAIDVAGNRSAMSDGFVITIDFTSPAKPVITGISDDTGSSSSDGVTSDRNLLIHGTAEAHANVEVFSPGGLIGTVAADANGDWALDITAFNLPEMVANTTAQAIDVAGNRSAISDGFVIIIDFTGPTASLSAPAGPTGGSYLVTAQFGEDITGLTLSDITVATGTASNLITIDASTYTFTVNSGNNTVDVNIGAGMVSDIAGNANMSSNVLNLDFTAPPVLAQLENSLADFVKSEQIRLYPNPAREILTIDLSELSAEEVDIRFVNAAGVSVFERESFTGKTLRLDVSGYRSGLYIVQLYDGTAVIRKKVVVRK